MDFADAHIHLPAYSDPEPVVELARRSGVVLVSCTVNTTEARVNIDLGKRHPDTVVPFVGVHPSDVTSGLPGEDLERLAWEAQGIGEIGLDAKYSDPSPGSLQMDAFVDQLSLAERLGKPVQVHSRGSEKACLAVLSTFKISSVLLHWLEAEEVMPEVESKGYFVSVGPALLYSKRIRRIASRVPAGRILTETDGPVSYKAVEGRSGPVLLPSVVFALAEVRSTSFEVLASKVAANLQEYLRPR